MFVYFLPRQLLTILKHQQKFMLYLHRHASVVLVAVYEGSHAKHSAFISRHWNRKRKKYPTQWPLTNGSIVSRSGGDTRSLSPFLVNCVMCAMCQSCHGKSVMPPMTCHSCHETVLLCHVCHEWQESALPCFSSPMKQFYHKWGVPWVTCTRNQHYPVTAAMKQLYQASSRHLHLSRWWLYIFQMHQETHSTGYYYYY